jgi:hypothetical protein
MMINITKFKLESLTRRGNETFVIARQAEHLSHVMIDHAEFFEGELRANSLSVRTNLNTPSQFCKDFDLQCVSFQFFHPSLLHLHSL